MPTVSRASRAREARLKAVKAAPILPKEVTDRTDRLVEISDACETAKSIADGMGEAFLAYLLSMVVEEARTAMRRANLAAPMPPKVRAARGKLAGGKRPS